MDVDAAPPTDATSATPADATPADVASAKYAAVPTAEAPTAAAHGKQRLLMRHNIINISNSQSVQY